MNGQIVRGPVHQRATELLGEIPAGVVGAFEDLLRVVEHGSEQLGHQLRLDATLLTERAVAAGFGPRGSISWGGSCRMVQAADGWLALNLARPDDRPLVAAWLEHGDMVSCPLNADLDALWAEIERRCRSMPVSLLLERGALLGMALSAVPASLAPVYNQPVAVVTECGTASDRTNDSFLVVDLSSLWAGPLCARVLGMTGARVMKVESAERPDGARLGAPSFFEALHAGHDEVSFAFKGPGGHERLSALLDKADVVIEASRPRALQQLGVDAKAMVAARPGKIWLSLTAYGRTGSDGARVGFGDDVAAGAGLVRWVGGVPHFVGDAIADPIAGVVAAGAVLDARRRGGGVLVDVSMHRAAAALARTARRLKGPRARRGAPGAPP